MAAKEPDDNSVAITRLLVARREFWYAVLALIGAVALIVLVTLAVYPQLLSEIVDLWDEDPDYAELFIQATPECGGRMHEMGCLRAYDAYLETQQ